MTNAKQKEIHEINRRLVEIEKLLDESQEHLDKSVHHTEESEDAIFTARELTREVKELCACLSDPNKCKEDDGSSGEEKKDEEITREEWDKLQEKFITWLSLSSEERKQASGPTVIKIQVK